MRVIESFFDVPMSGPREATSASMVLITPKTYGRIFDGKSSGSAAHAREWQETAHPTNTLPPITVLTEWAVALTTQPMIDSTQPTRRKYRRPNMSLKQSEP